MQATTVRIPYAQLKVGAQVRVKVGLLFMRQYDLVSRVWEGEIQELKWWGKEHLISKEIDRSKLGTLRAIQLIAVPSMADSAYCHKCGQYIEREQMRVFGYGIGCVEKIGIPEWTYFNDEQIDEFREHLPLQFRREMWVTIEHSEFEVLKDAPIETEQQREWDVRFTIENNEIVVATTPDFRWVVRSVPGWRWDAKYNVWRFPKSPSIAGHLKAAFSGYRRRGTKEFLALVQQNESQQEAQNIKTMENLPPIPHLKGNGGWSHQRQAYAYIIRTLTGKNPYDKSTDSSGSED